MTSIMIDATVFLGMNSKDEGTRRRCKAFVASGRARTLLMTFDEIGACDDVIWRRPRALQDAYYPFMDALHSDFPFERIGYSIDDLALALELEQALTVRQRLLVAASQNRGVALHTVDRALLATGREHVAALPVAEDRATDAFPEPLERLYAASLLLRL